MISVPVGVRTIEEYPFRVENLIVDVLGKPTDWRQVVNNLHNAEMYEKLASHVHSLGAHRIVCPKPVHKEEISSSKKLRRVTVSRDQVAMYRGSDGDGAIVKRGEVYALPSADCIMVAVSDPEQKQVVAVHFSRETGVVKDILGTALERFTNRQKGRLVAIIALGIAPEHFDHPWDHPKFGDKNKALSKRLLKEFGGGALEGPPERGCINLRWIAAKKLIGEGVYPDNIYVGKIDTHSNPEFWSNKASQDPNSEKYSEEGRNLALVGNVL